MPIQSRWLSVLLLLVLPTVAQAITWDGGGDGTNWSDPLNWSTNAVPTALDDVLLDGGISVALDVPAQTAGLTLDSAIISGSANLTVNGLLDWGLGEHAGSGTWTILGGATLTANDIKTIQGIVDFNCDVVWEPSAIVFGASGRVIHQAGFDFDVVPSGSKSKRGITHNAIPQSGTDPTADSPTNFVFTFGGSTNLLAPIAFDVSVQNLGGYVSAADVEFNSGSDNSGSMSLAVGVDVWHREGTHTLRGTYTTTGGGFPNGLRFNGNQTEAVFDTGFSASADIPVIASGPLSLAVDLVKVTLSEAIINISLGIFNGDLNFTGINNSLTATNGPVTLTGSALFDTNSPTLLDGDFTFTNGMSVLGAGLVLEEGSDIVVPASGSFIWDSSLQNQTISPAANEASLRIEGLLRIVAGSQTPRVFTWFDLVTGGTLNIEAGAIFQLENDSNLQGSVVLDGDLYLRQGNHSMLDPFNASGPGTIEVQSAATLETTFLAALEAYMLISGTLITDDPTEFSGGLRAGGGTFSGNGWINSTGITDFDSGSAVDANDINVDFTCSNDANWFNGPINLQDATLETAVGTSFYLDHVASALPMTNIANGFFLPRGMVSVRNHAALPPRIEVPFLFSDTSSLVLDLGTIYPKIEFRDDGSIEGNVHVGFGCELNVTAGTTTLNPATPAQGDGQIYIDTNGRMVIFDEVDVRTTVRGELSAANAATFKKPLRSEGGTFSGGNPITAENGVTFEPDTNVDATVFKGSTFFTMQGVSYWYGGDIVIEGNSRVITGTLSEFNVIQTGSNLGIKEDPLTSALEVFELNGELHFRVAIGTTPSIEADLQTNPGSLLHVEPGVTLAIRDGGTIGGNWLLDATSKVRVLFEELIFSTTGVLGGNGRVESSLGGRVNMQGTVDPGDPAEVGILEVIGAWDWDADAKVTWDVHEFAADQLTMSGAQLLNGTLEVRINDTRTQGSFMGPVLTAGSVTGAFHTTTLLGGVGFIVNTIYQSPQVLVTLTAQPGTIQGVLFDDDNTDGQLTAGELPIQGWTVDLLDDQGSTIASTVSDAGGNYSFPGLTAPQVYFVQPQLPGGWIHTNGPANGQPNAGVLAEVQPNTTTTLNLGFSDVSGRIVGQVVHDIDGDGVLDVADPALRGVQVVAVGVDVPGTTTVVSDEDGNFEFVLVPGTYNIAPIPFPGWQPAFPTPLPTLTIAAGDVIENNYLGIDSPRRSVRGIVFLDVNQNGEFDRLIDTVVAPDKVRIDGALGTEPQTFEGYGVGRQYGALLGSSSFTVSHPTDEFRILSPPGGILEIRSAAESGNDIVQNFALVPGSVLSGYVYLDLEQDMLNDPAVDKPFAQKKINISGVGKVTTDANGFFSVPVDPGDYTITVVHPNITQSGPTVFTVASNSAKNIEIPLVDNRPTVLVNTLADIVPGSLRDAILNLNAGQAARLRLELVTGVAVLQQALPSLTVPTVVESALTLKLASPQLVVDGSSCVGCDGLILQADGNVIRGLQFQAFPGHGLVVQSSENLISGNAFVGNGGNGIEIESGDRNKIGLASGDRGNLVQNNAGAGIRVAGGTRTEISGNFISGNTGLPIDVVSMDPPRPTLQYLDSAAEFITGVVQGDPFETYVVEVFGNAACAGGDQGPAETYLGTVMTEADATGLASFSAPVAGPADFWTATATVFGGSTSEVSVCLDVNVTAVKPLPLNESVTHFAYPNPARGNTQISFGMTKSAHTRVRVYNLAGRLVDTLHEGQLPPGRHEVRWSGADNRGQPVASGIYFYELRIGSETYTQKIARIQ